MTDAERQRAIWMRADALVSELRRLAETDPERLSSVDFMVLAINALAGPAVQGRTVTLAPDQVSILVDGVVELLTDWAAGEVDRETDRTAVLERELASKPPAILH